MVLLSTHETLHIKKYTLYSESNVLYILFDIYRDASMYQGSSCWGFTLLLQLLKSKNSVQTCFAINSTFASSANMSKLLLLEWDFSETYYSLCWWMPWRYVFPRGSTLSINSPFWKSPHIWRYITGEIKTSFLGKVRIKTHRFLCYFWTFLLGMLVNSVDPQGNTSSH